VNTDEKKKLKLDIEKKIIELKKRIVVLKDLTQPIEPDCAIGRVSRMDAINNKSVNEAALRHKENQLSALEEAYKTIDEEAFGVCIKCGKTIPIGRILIMPESKKCVNCASR
jgi:DnaK suppressor protein